MGYGSAWGRTQAKMREELEERAYAEALYEAKLKIRSEQEMKEQKEPKPIVTVVVPLLRKDYTLDDVKKELGDEYHVVPVLNKEAIKVHNGEPAKESWTFIEEPNGSAHIEPELKASDFPCLMYGHLDAIKRVICFYDETYFYYISEHHKQAERPRGRQQYNINEKIKVEKCQIKHIKKGDYFITKFNYDSWKDDIKSYKYCTKVTIASIETLSGYDGIFKEGIYFPANDVVYRFTLK